MIQEERIMSVIQEYHSHITVILAVVPAALVFCVGAIILIRRKHA